MANTILLAIMFLLGFLLFYFLPTLNGQRTLFGITLKNDDFQSYGAPILKKFRRDLILLILGGCAAVITLYMSRTVSKNSLVITYSVATFGAIFLLFRYLRQTWKLRDRRTISRWATSLK